MLIIPVLADAFLPSCLFSCRLKGLEPSVSSPSSTYQLSGSAALIIIWPNLFGWLTEFWFWCRMLCEHHKLGVSIHLAALSLFYFPKGYFETKPPMKQSHLMPLCPGLRPFFFLKSLPINIKSWHWVAPLFSLPSPDKEHPHKHTGTTLLKVTLTGWQAGDKCEYGQKQKPNNADSAINLMQNMDENGT